MITISYLTWQFGISYSNITAVVKTSSYGERFLMILFYWWNILCIRLKSNSSKLNKNQGYSFPLEWAPVCCTADYLMLHWQGLMHSYCEYIVGICMYVKILKTLKNVKNVMHWQASQTNVGSKQYSRLKNREKGLIFNVKPWQYPTLI